MRGSLVYDALYQLLREKYFDKEEYRKPADRLLKKMCEEDGMNALRAWCVYLGIRFFGGSFANPVNKKPVIETPKQCR